MIANDIEYTYTLKLFTNVETLMDDFDVERLLNKGLLQKTIDDTWSGLRNLYNDLKEELEEYEHKNS